MKSAISQIYSLVTTIRNLLFDWGVLRTYKSSIPVISVGNISAGGTGKTPCVIYIASLLKSKGFKPVVLSRGYGGSFQGVISSEDDPLVVGDEPIMISRRLNIPVVVFKSRVKGAKLIEEKALGNVIILDDGLQHRYLARKLDLVLIPIDSAERIDDFILNRLIPHGMLRENTYQALKRASAVIFSERKINKSSEASTLVPYIPSSLPCFLYKIDSASVLDSSGKPLPPQKIHVVCGIAHPQSFVETLKSLGFEIISLTTYPDHHYYPKSSIETIRLNGKEFPVVCTEKDWVKLSRVQGITVYWCKIETSISLIRGDDDFSVFLEKQLISRDC